MCQDTAAQSDSTCWSLCHCFASWQHFSSCNEFSQRTECPNVFFVFVKVIPKPLSYLSYVSCSLVYSNNNVQTSCCLLFVFTTNVNFRRKDDEITKRPIFVKNFETKIFLTHKLFFVHAGVGVFVWEVRQTQSNMQVLKKRWLQWTNSPQNVFTLNQCQPSPQRICLQKNAFKFGFVRNALAGCNK